MICGVLRWPFYMLLGMMYVLLHDRVKGPDSLTRCSTVATLVSIAWDNILTCISEGRKMVSSPVIDLFTVQAGLPRE